MRSIILLAGMLFLLPLSMYRPFVGVLTFDMISFLNPQQIVWGIGSKPPWALLAFFATIIGWIASRNEPKRIPLNAMNILIVVFMIGITINMAFALAPFAKEYEAWSRTIKIFLFLLITSALANTKQRIDALIWVIIISIGFYILDQGTLSIITLGHHKAFGPPNSQITDNNVFAAAILVLVPFMNYLRLQSHDKLIRSGFILAMGLGLLTSLSSYSRGALLGLGAMAFVLWLRSRHKLLSLVILSTALAVGLYFMPQTWWARMSLIEHYQTDASAMGRLYIWRVGWLLALKHPLTGAGFHATDFQSVIDTVAPGGRHMEIHSIWFQILGEQGFVVSAIWLMMTLTAAWNTWKLIRLAKGRPEFTWAGDLGRMGQVSIVAFVVTGTFLPISTWDIYFTVLTIICTARLVVSRQIAAERATATLAPKRLSGKPFPQVGLGTAGQARPI